MCIYIFYLAAKHTLPPTILHEISSSKPYFCRKLIFAYTVFLAKDFFLSISFYLALAFPQFFQGASLCSVAVSLQILPETNHLMQLMANQ